MGVTGLLRLLQPYSEPRTISHFNGKTLGVDGYAWLHRAAASCAEDLIRGIASPRLVQSIDNRVRVYEQNNIELYFVFDGGSLAMKERVEKQRRRAREAARAQSSSSGSNASTALRAVDITANHAAMIIAYLKTRGIKFVVAPYEADAELVYLESLGLIDGIISEDSDLLVFGAKSLLTKSDAKTGACIEVGSRNLPSPLSDLKCLRALAIISGCDYSPGVAGMGPVKSKALVSRFGGDLDAMIRNLVASQRVDETFIELARQADLAFQFQRVWNPLKCCLAHLNSPEDVTHLLTDSIVGNNLSRPLAHRIAVGQVDPHNQSVELVVHPVIAQFVQKMRPIKPMSQSVYSTPLGVSKIINRRLQTTPLPTPANSISRFFQPRNRLEKENCLPTPQSSGSPAPKRLFSTSLPSESIKSEVAVKIMRTDTIVDTNNNDTICVQGTGDPSNDSTKKEVTECSSSANPTFTQSHAFVDSRVLETPKDMVTPIASYQSFAESRPSAASQSTIQPHTFVDSRIMLETPTKASSSIDRANKLSSLHRFAFRP